MLTFVRDDCYISNRESLALRKVSERQFKSRSGRKRHLLSSRTLSIYYRVVETIVVPDLLDVPYDIRKIELSPRDDFDKLLETILFFEYHESKILLMSPALARPTQRDHFVRRRSWRGHVVVGFVTRLFLVHIFWSTKPIDMKLHIWKDIDLREYHAQGS